MSIWSFDIGIDPNWPEWFVAYRRQVDAALRSRAQARINGELTEAEFKAWALEDARRHGQWVQSLSPDRRAWLEAQEAEDQLLPELPNR